MAAGDPRVTMWAEACELLDRAERLHRQFFKPGRAATRRPTWEPPIDVFETDSELWIVVALPGVAPDGLELAIEGGAVVVGGERRLPPTLRTASIHRIEIPYGRFERRIQLPAGRFELGAHQLADGCLVLGLRKLW